MRNIGLVLAVAFVPTVATSAYAQFLQSPNQNQYSKSANQGEATAKNSFKRESSRSLVKEISIPEIPAYPGAKFRTGEEVIPSATVTRGCSIDYTLPINSSSQVVNFYRNIFSAGGWKINQETGTSIDAANERSNSHCNISVDGPNNAPGNLHINYAESPKGNYSGG